MSHLEQKEEGTTAGGAQARQADQTRQAERHARELARTNTILREKVQEKTALLEAASHDLKNPFFGIRALSEIVLENERLHSSDERKIRLIRNSAAEALQHIDDLLRSAAETRKGSANLTVLDATDLVQWVVQGFAPQAEWKGQHLRCAVDDAPCDVKGDQRQLREAVSNLVSNALKYAPSGARIDVVVERRGEEVRIAVTDEGPGLSEKDQERMFAPFQRLSPEPTGGESASGLGLYLLKQIVERHEGRVEVVSARGEGSTFALLLPAVGQNENAS